MEGEGEGDGVEKGFFGVTVEGMDDAVVGEDLELGSREENGEEPVIVFGAIVGGVSGAAFAADAAGAGGSVVAIGDIGEGNLAEELDEIFATGDLPDGMLDAVGSEQETGKSVGTDVLNGRQTFLTLAYAQDLRLAVAAFWIRGALMQMNQPISTAFAMEQVPADQQAVTNSARQLAWNLAWTASTQLGGVWIARSGFEPPILAAVVLYVMASASFAWFFGRKVKVSVA